MNSENNNVYERPTLVLLKKNEEKGTIFPSLLFEYFKKNYTNTYNKFLSSSFSNLYHFYYNCESVEDYNWGCAFRSLQTLLMYVLSKKYKENMQKEDECFVYQKYIQNISFEKLFIKHCSREKIFKYFQELKGINYIPEYLLNRKFIPHETHHGWGEPFISQLICHHFGLSSGNIFLVGNYIEDYLAPKEVFNSSISFSSFVQKLFTHFSGPLKAPVILDDAKVSVDVVGIRLCDKNNNNADISNYCSVEFIILDPHADKYSKGEWGLYIAKVDKLGNKIVVDENIKIQKYIKENNANYTLNNFIEPFVCDIIYFNNKTWAVFMLD